MATGVFFFTSTDGGASWSRRGTIVAAPLTHNETTWVRLDNGDLFAAVRTYGDQCLEGFRSNDGGRTWQFERALTMPLQLPGDLLKLPDGRVLLSYGARNRGLYGIWVRMGDPELKAWSAPMLLVDFEGASEFQQSPVPSSDGGYPSTVQLQDGTFVTAYYSRGVPPASAVPCRRGPLETASQWPAHPDASRAVKLPGLTASSLVRRLKVA
jgi:hypothetical protein